MQISEHIHAVRIPFQVTTPSGMVLERFVFSYLIYGETITVIDTGVVHGERIIFDYVASTGRDIREIARVLHTHAHPDHIGATREIVSRTGARAAMHPAERHWLEDVEVQYAERPVPGFHALVGGSAAVDDLLVHDQQIILDATISLRVLHTPGHSPGSVSLVLEQEKVLFSGDAVPLPGELPIYDDVYTSLASIETLRQHGEIQLLLAAWDTPRTGREVNDVMQNAWSYLQQIHATLRRAANGSRKITQDIVMRTLPQLGIPAAAVNPLIVRSLASHLPYIDQPEILLD